MFIFLEALHHQVIKLLDGDIILVKTSGKVLIILLEEITDLLLESMVML